MGPEEFAALYDAQVGIVRSVLVRVVSGAHGSQLDDLTQDVFLRAWRGRAEFRGAASGKTWLCKIARNLGLDLLRSRSGREEVGLAALETRPAPGVLPEARAMLIDALERLAPDDRLLLLLLSVEECTMSEIGEVLEIPIGTVKSRAFALRQRLRERVGQKGAA